MKIEANINTTFPVFGITDEGINREATDIALAIKDAIEVAVARAIKAPGWWSESVVIDGNFIGSVLANGEDVRP